MKLRIIAIGRFREEPLRAIADQYVKRINRYARVEIVEIERKGRDAAQRIRRIVTPRDHVVALDEKGRTFTSESFARHLDDLLAGCERIVFIVGEAEGLPREISGLIEERLSLSSMTLQHDIARIVFLEQLYRAFSILKGEPYHK
jgi:23S rRNA (pseudouridine1915-N3)-methyltransferase